nr:hypothetical protein [Tanacetum cinerariifolium]GEV56601.1 hypothetical protein [Tanacetum cinerariifolium]
MLVDVRTALDDRLKEIRMKYLLKSIWRKSDKDRAAAMIQAIDKMLKTRRIMRSLERYKELKTKQKRPEFESSFGRSTINVDLLTCHVDATWLPRHWRLANQRPPRGGSAATNNDCRYEDKWWLSNQVLTHGIGSGGFTVKDVSEVQFEVRLITRQ